MIHVDDLRSPGPIIVGSGAAGLTSALRLGDCLVLTKTGLTEGSSRWAQGGIAAAVGPADTPDVHARDTMTVSRGLADPAIVEIVAAAAEARIEWLIEMGAHFDRDATGEIALGREAGHSRNRIIHANGDATGAELMRTLREAVADRSDIEIIERAGVVDLIRADEGIAGVLAEIDGRRIAFIAPVVILATGGIGRVFARTTNPPEVTGDGLAMALRAGLEIRDPEFVQFHPTALRSKLDPMPLLTETLRGAGASLIDGTGRRFMVDVHPDAELAPRDVVARAIWSRTQRGDDVRLDATGLADLPQRFPTLFGHAMEAGLDPRQVPLPVSPAAHYHMGGIAVDAAGRAARGLYVCGEAAASGLHGANRLASNSLIEALVFGAMIGDAIRTDHADVHPESPTWTQLAAGPDRFALDDDAAIDELRSIMWNDVGVIRTGERLAHAILAIDALQHRLVESYAGRNLLDVARVVTESALRRRESRGGHHRADYPRPSTAWAASTRITPEPTRQVPLPALVPYGAA